jgi:hypothetical protein
MNCLNGRKRLHSQIIRKHIYVNVAKVDALRDVLKIDYMNLTFLAKIYIHLRLSKTATWLGLNERICLHTSCLLLSTAAPHGGKSYKHQKDFFMHYTIHGCLEREQLCTARLRMHYTAWGSLVTTRDRHDVRKRTGRGEGLINNYRIYDFQSVKRTGMYSSFSHTRPYKLPPVNVFYR